jgi:hypothetical protein
MKKLILLILSLSSTLTAFGAVTNPTILYIGDSHSYGKLGTTIESNLKTISDHVIMESSCGSSAYTWLGKTGLEKTVCGFWKKDGSDEVRTTEHQTPKFSEEKTKYAPKVVIIQLGTNMAAAENPSNSKGSIDQLMKQAVADNSACIWVGPPDANSKIVTREKLQIVNSMIKEIADNNGCYFIDSLQLTSFPADSKEGIHYPPSLSKEWGEKVSAIVLNHLKDL